MPCGAHALALLSACPLELHSFHRPRSAQRWGSGSPCRTTPASLAALEVKLWVMRMV